MKRRILPMIMAVMIILSIIQVPAWAADGDVLEVNGTGYSELSEALSAIEAICTEGGTASVTLLADVTWPYETQHLEIVESWTVELDLNGHYMAGTNSASFLVNRGTLTINDSSAEPGSNGIGSGRIYTTNIDAQGRHAVENYGTLTINGGIFGDNNTDQGDANNNQQRGNALRNYGTTTINGGAFTACDNYVNGGYAYAIANGDSTYSDATMTINYATVYGKMNGGIAADGGTLTILDGDYRLGGGSSSWRMGYTSGNGCINIDGGTFVKSDTNTTDQGFFGGNFIISGGSFEDEVHSTIYFDFGDIQISGGEFKKELSASNSTEVSVTGGTFSSDVSEYLDPSCNMEQSEGSWVVTPLTKEDATASVGGKYYNSLSAAIAAAGDGDTVTLLKNTNEDIVIPEEAELILDLNGKTLTNVSGDTITNNGTLTITGDGTVDNVTHGKAAIQNEPGGTVVLNGGAYTRSKENGKSDVDSGGNSYYNIVNHGTMEINDGVSVTQTGHFSSMIENGWYDGNQNKGNQNSVLTINGGTFSGGLNTIKNDDYGELTINDGTFENMSQATFLNWNIATVNGGTFNAENASSGAILNGYINDSMDQGELTINGGTFNAGEQNAVIATMNGAHSGDIEITGGTLNGSIVLTDNQDGAQLTITQDAKINGNVTNSGRADVAITDGATVSGQVSNGTNGTMSVVNSTIGSVPQDTTSDSIVIVNSYVDNVLITNTGDKAIMVGGKTYDTMAEAIEAVGDGQTIYVLKDIPNAVGIAVPSNKNFTIDFGGHTYTLIGPGAGSSGTETNGFQLLRDSTITFKNGTIRIAEGANNIKRIIQNYADLTLEDMHIYAENQVPDENYALSFNNGDITFKGDTDVITTSDDVIAFDICKFSNYPSASVTFDESYTGTINGKIVYDSTSADTHKLVIQGDGTFGTIEPSSTAGADTAANSGITITSGHFAGPVKEEYLADSVKAQLKSASNPEAPYSYYPSVEDAIAAAKPGDTVTAVNTEPTKEKYTVTLNFNDGKTDNLTYEVSEGTAIDLPTPSRSGYTFEGWYDGSKRVSSPYTVTKTVTLTAEWDYKDDNNNSSSSSSSVRRYDIKADAGRGGDISPDGRVRVRRGENQTFRITADDGYEIYDVEVDGESVGAVSRYTFENVREDHTISATFRQTGAQTEEAQLPFLDVAEGAWYYDAVTYCYENGIMDGTSSVSFAPGMLLNRAMAAQVLYNLADGTASTAAGFPDVAASAWYADAVNWAAANGYVTGYDNGSFGPEDSLTREQLAVILYRYAGFPEPTGSLDGFTDAASASDYAVDALRWAVGEGLLTGKDGGRLDPAGTASRAELAQILARFAQM